jgi:hypothetical protein
MDKGGAMSPQQKDPVLVAIARLSDKVDHLTKKVENHEKQLKWIVSAAILVIGALGGPDMVNVLGGAA